MKLKEVNYYGFNHEMVAQKFTGGLTYIRTFSIRGYHWAVYKAANPNRELGHKDYMMLGGQPDINDPDLKMRYHVSGSTPEQMEEERYQEAILCTKCDTVIYSINRHHYHYCPCGASFVDGGKDYLRHGGASLNDQEIVKLDLITGQVVELGGTKLPKPITLDSYRSENDILAKERVAAKPAKSHRSEKPKKRLTARRKSGKVKASKPRSKK